MTVSLKITQKKSAIGGKPKHRETLRSLGFKRPGQTVVRDDSPEVRGYIRSVAHLVDVEEIDS